MQTRVPAQGPTVDRSQRRPLPAAPAATPAQRILAAQRHAGNRAVAHVLARDTTATVPGPPASRALQRRVLTIGEEDAEVRLGRTTLMEDAHLGDGGTFLDVDRLITGEPEIILGHGTETAIGQKEPPEMAELMKAKMEPQTHYNVVFFACKTGVSKTLPQPVPALSSVVQSMLQKDGYNIEISAPKGIALILGNRRYLVTQKFPAPAHVPDVMPQTRAKVTSTLDLVAGVAEADMLDVDWQHDVAELRSRNWPLSKAQPAPKSGTTWHSIFKAVIAKRKEDVAGLSIGSLTNNQKAVAKLRSSVLAGVQDAAAAFPTWYEDLVQAKVTEGWGETVTARNAQQPDPEAQDIISDDVRALGLPGWQKDSPPPQPQVEEPVEDKDSS